MNVCRQMSSPTIGAMRKLKRIGRYLRHRPRAKLLYAWQGHDAMIHCHSDSDWAGDKATRRSVSGGVLYRGSHCIKSWAKLQSVVAKSSAEAELYAAGRAATEALGAAAYLRDLGQRRSVRLHLDSSSALSLISKTGLGKAKHIEIQHLWLQEAVRSKRLECSKIHTDVNSGDLLTKSLAADRVVLLMDICGYKFDR